MLSFEINKGNNIVTRPDRRGRTVTGQVISKGPKFCGVLEAGTNQTVRVPYELIIACDNNVVQAVFVKAKKDDIVKDRKGVQYRVDKVNSTRYTVTRIQDGKGFYLPFISVVEIVDKKNVQRQFLQAKGFSDADVKEFEGLFA